ncbi:MAG: hypothetical protein AAF826_03880 [Pseudomonadota bacterium]
MIDAFLSLFGLGSGNAKGPIDDDTKASKIISRVEKVSGEASVRLAFETQRLGNKANTFGMDAKASVAPLVELQKQNADLRSLVDHHSDRLAKDGADTEFLAVIDQWAASSDALRQQVDLTAEEIEQSLEKGR